ncbi:uncharacterized protein Tco025E_00399 [Trypanosoma conorhini]|uniref:Uncharacterized protein n=1 Tax=Trypanosoma conorhini TaxID=83891 RepID=A0A3R7M683_9TRYP|nr:uncharacterized protein Tco025E_00399 [Trypanosoma conorhini]RNF27329.1 hypothetical protein Tco025E_00399 [Trypanosoma conorhini]
MLRRTLRCLLEQEGPSTLKRAVMAKAHPLHASPGTRKGAAYPRRSGTAGMTHDAGAAVDAPVAPAAAAAAASSSPAAAAAVLPSSREQPHGDASEDAYRFLLHHIDSEIAALKRRITTVAKQRESVESGQARRIRELFECMERPWLMLESIPAPQLPNRALEVYAKELYTKQHGPDAGNCEQDAVFLDACRRNWRGLALEQRKPYEVAARRNEHLRRELKKKLSNGCSYFESFCEQLREWTAETARKEKALQPQSASRAPPRGTAPATRKKSPSPAKTTHAAAAAEAPAPKSAGRAEERRSPRLAQRAPARNRAAKATKSALARASAVRRPQAPRRQRPKPNRAHRAKSQPPKKSVAKRRRSHAR